MAFEGPTALPLEQDHSTPQEEEYFTVEEQEALAVKLETLQKKIEKNLSILTPPDTEESEYVKDQYDALIADAESFLVRAGQPVSELALLEKADEFLIPRLHQVVDDIEGERNKNFDIDLSHNARIALMVNHDYSKHLSQNSNLDEIAQHFRWISQKGHGAKEVLSEKDIDLLFDAGYADNLLANNFGRYHPEKYMEFVPEKLLIHIINNIDTKHMDGYTLEGIFEDAIKKDRHYSSAVFQILLDTPFSPYCLRYFKVFEGVDIKQAVRYYDPRTPHRSHDLLRYVKEQGQDTQEVIKYIIQHYKNYYSGENEILESYEKKISGSISLGYYRGEGLNEGALQYGKELIAQGNIGLLFNDRTGGVAIIQQLISEDYDWVMEQVEKYDQEHLILDEMKPETIRKYIFKLIESGDTIMLKKLFTKSPSGSNAFKSGSLEASIYEELVVLLPGLEIDEEQFSGLSGESFNKKMNSFADQSLKNQWALRSINRFNFEDNTEFGMYKEYQSFVSSFTEEGAQNFLQDIITRSVQSILNISVFLETPTEKRSQIKQRIESSMDSLARNQPLSEEDGDIYELICMGVYPQRNYNTYKYTEEYKDRSQDVEQYTFDEAGYGVQLDGVSEYRVKQGESINPILLETYTKRIQSLSRIANPEQLEGFLTVSLGEETEHTAKTLEGKILQYMEGRTDEEIADILFAYQIREEYEVFIHGTRDQLGDQSSQSEKEYIMLTELAERYGDRLKETIKEILEKVARGPDKNLFIGAKEEMISGSDITELGGKILEELEVIPKEKLTDAIVQKKITKSLKNRFQQILELKDEAQSIAEEFSIASLPNLADLLLEKVSEVLKSKPTLGGIDSNRIEAIQNKTYQEIQRELEKYEEVMETDTLKASLGAQEKTAKKRPIRGYFSKNRENAHARMVADVCLAWDPKMLENPNYFEFVLFDEERKKNIGTVMLLAMEDTDGKKYLLYCPNPSTDIVSKVSSGKLYQWLTRQVSAFAEINGFDAVLADTTHGRGTNRPGKFHEVFNASVLKSAEGVRRTIDLSEVHMLGGSYTYQKGLSMIWER